MWLREILFGDKKIAEVLYDNFSLTRDAFLEQNSNALKEILEKELVVLQ